MVNKWQVRNDFSKGDVMKRWYVVCAVVALGMRLIYPAAIARDTLVLAVQELKRTRVGGVKDAVKRYAEQAGYGYKTANLVELKMLSQAFNTYKDNATLLAVPEFRGVASEQIQRVLREQEFDCVARWEAVVKTLPANVAETKTFPAEFLAARQKFSDELQEAWQRVVGAYAAQEATPLNEFFATDGLDELVTSVTAAGSRFMVRSTGKEDTAELANAGGNESIANVEPAPKALLQAIGSVVLSYFGLKSLTQRLSLGDETVTLPEVFTPVLLQAMVGEQADDAQPPRCGVMFTQEAEGAIVPDDKTYSTTGITLIQAGYGHNEGVVNSIIAVDTYYVMDMPGAYVAHPEAVEGVSSNDQPAVYPVVRNKIDRLVPETGGMVRVANSKEQAQQSALSRDEIITLKEFAWALEAYYECAMDVEFVVKDGTFSIVQARPIVHKSPDLAPSYIAHAERFTSFKGSTIGAAGGSVRTITQKAQLLVAATIEAALGTYLEPGFAREQVAAIIVGAIAPSTSHAATTFRNEGKPVLYIPDYEKLKPVLDDDMMLLVSPQQNAVFQVSSENEAAAAGGGVPERKGPALQSPIREGWISYPVPRALSVQRELIGCDMNVQPGAVQEPRQVAKLVAWSELLDSMKKEKQSEVQIACARYMAQLARLLHESTAHGDFKVELQSIFDAAVSLCKDIVAVAAIAPDAPNYTARLLPIRMLEALTYQHFDRQDVVQGFSVATMGNALQQERAIARSFEVTQAGAAVAESLINFGNNEAREYYIQLQKVKGVIYAPAVQGLWEDLTKMLAEDRSVDSIKLLANLVADMTKYKLVPLWLHTSFMDIGQALEQQKSAKRKAAIAQQFIAWKRALGTDFLKQLAAKQQLIAQTTLGAFADSGRYKAAYGAFNRDLISFFVSREFQDGFSAASKLEQCAATQVMGDFTQLFDLIIKTVKGSRALPLDNKLQIFRALLRKYYKLMRTWFDLLPADAIRFGVSPAEAYFAGIMSVLERIDDFRKNDLEPTGGFNVAAWTLGSATALEAGRVTPPKAGEDVFSMMHQNTLVIVGALTRLAGAETMQRPQLLTHAETMLQQTIERVRSMIQSNGISRDADVPNPNMVSAVLEAQAVRLSYNCALRRHSCQFVLTYHPAKKVGGQAERLDVTLQFYGREPLRWQKITSVAVLLELLDVASVDSIVLLGSGTSFTIHVTNQTRLDKVQGAIADMLYLTYDEGRTEGLLDWNDLLGDKLNGSYNDVVKRIQKKLGKTQVAPSDLVVLSMLLNNRYQRAAGNVDDIFIRDAFCLHANQVPLSEYINKLCEKYLRNLKMRLRNNEYINDDYRKAVLAAAQCITSCDEGEGQRGKDGVAKEALELFMALIEKGWGYDQAISFAQKNISTYYDADQNNQHAFNLRYKAIDIFTALFQKGQAFDEAIAVAEQCMQNPNSLVQRTGINLFLALIKKGQGYDAAIAAAKKAMASDVETVQSLGEDFFARVSEELAARSAGVATP
jgi:hypothetical protein